jgi:hypothetical protein
MRLDSGFYVKLPIHEATRVPEFWVASRTQFAYRNSIQQPQPHKRRVR